MILNKTNYIPSEYAPPSAYDVVSEDSKLRLPETKINVKK